MLVGDELLFEAPGHKVFLGRSERKPKLNKSTVLLNLSATGSVDNKDEVAGQVSNKWRENQRMEISHTLGSARSTECLSHLNYEECE